MSAHRAGELDREAERVSEEAGDVEGYGVWIRIMGCISKLAKLQRDGDDTLH